MRRSRLPEVANATDVLLLAASERRTPDDVELALLREPGAQRLDEDAFSYVYLGPELSGDEPVSDPFDGPTFRIGAGLAFGDTDLVRDTQLACDGRNLLVGERAGLQDYADIPRGEWVRGLAKT